MTRPNSEEQILLLGALLVHWNNIENQLREILAVLAPHALTARLLSADFQSGNLISVTRMMAKERHSINTRINSALKEKRKKAKIVYPFLQHVEFFLSGVDSLREHRNYYVHGSIYSEKSGVELFKVSARKRFAISGVPIECEDLRRLIDQIIEFEKYGISLIDALAKNESPTPDLRPRWPKRPATPQKLKLRRIVFDGALPELLES